MLKSSYMNAMTIPNRVGYQQRSGQKIYGLWPLDRGLCPSVGSKLKLFEFYLLTAFVARSYV
ncbi:MAG TPA: hypothetical protein VGI03_08925 [Verrucomicrobiae bacterium]